jgi:hypothetical protein
MIGIKTSDEAGMFVGDADRLDHHPGDGEQHAADDQRNAVVDRERNTKLRLPGGLFIVNASNGFR